MPYNVFTDFHHAGLLQSLILLFEKRFGGNVFRPIGMEWATEGFWKVYDHPATQLQFLGIGSATPDGTPELNTVLTHLPLNENQRHFLPNEGVYFCHDIDSGRYNKAVTLSAFFQLPIDIVIASLPQHIEPFKRLCDMHPDKPKLVYQIGNAWNVPDNGTVKNVMASAIVPHPAGMNVIEYHQEFDTGIFSPDFTSDPQKNIYSFVNVFQDFPDYRLFEMIEKLMPGWQFRSFGGQCRDGAIGPSEKLAAKMREARFIWHTKAGGDGYGHVIHNAVAVGRPLIVLKAYYQGKMAEKLLQDAQTCLTIDGLSTQEIINKIEYFSTPDRYDKLCQNAYANFRVFVDFDREAEAVKEFLTRLQ